MRFWVLLGLVVICVLPDWVYAADDAPVAASLLFTPAETETVNGLLQKAPDGDRVIHLGAVIYYAPDDWIIWLQNRKWTPETDEPNLHVVDVKPNEVKLSLSGSGQGDGRIISLHPHQTYRLSD